MSEYFHVEKQLLDQFGTLNWSMVDQEDHHSIVRDVGH
jgi:hypothetical protein